MDRKPTYEEIEKQLQESEEKYRRLVESLERDYFIYSHDTVGAFTYVSPSITNVLGYTKKEFLRHFTDYLTDSHITDEVDRHTALSIKGEKQPPYEVEIYHKDGSARLLEVTEVPVFDEHGNVVAVEGIAHDITERKRSEEALRSKDYIIESASSAIATANLDGKMNYVNPSFLRIWGFDHAGEVLGHHFSEYWMVSERYDKMMQTLEEKGAWTQEIKAKKKDGTLFDVQVSAATVYDKAGTAVGIMSSCVDVTQRKAAEVALQNEKNKLQSFIDAMEYGLTIQDKDFNIIFQNRYMQDLFGGIGKKCYEVYEGEEAVCEGCPVEMAYNDGESHTAERETLLPSGETIFWENTASPIRDSKSDIVACLEITRNINERKRAEREKEKIEAQLQQAQKMEAIGTLAGGIAHDFNNILTAIFGYTELAQDNIQDKSKLEIFLNEVRTAGIRAKDLVQQILTFSRQAEKEIGPVQINIIIKEAIKLLRASLPTTIEIRQNIKSDSLIMGDPTQIHQIMMNLCTNAGHAMQEKGGVLEVGLEDVELDSEFTAKHPNLKPGTFMKLTVGDTGHGMSQEIMDRIFDPFYTTKEQGEGTGMGLSVAHGIVNSYGGTIVVYSEPGKGSIFKIFFPIIKKSLEPEGRFEKPVPRGSERILFVDDEKAIVAMCRQILESLGYDVTARTSSLDALELFKAHPDRFDLVITDMTMPNMTGIDLARELIAARPDIPIILCTGFSTEITEETATNIGIRALVSKPILKLQIAEAIRNSLDDRLYSV